MALAAGEPSLVGIAVDRIAKSFAVDRFLMHAVALEALNQTVRDSRRFPAVAASALDLASQAMDAKDWPGAQRLCAVAFTAARKAGDMNLSQRAADAARELSQRQVRGW